MKNNENIVLVGQEIIDSAKILYANNAEELPAINLETYIEVACTAATIDNNRMDADSIRTELLRNRKGL